MYTLLYRLVLCRIPAETAHRLAFGLIRLTAALPVLRNVVARWFAPVHPALRLRVLGLDLPGPLGLAAGFDKDARGVDALAALGFDFVEVGTVTARAQPGNPRPRMFRLPADRALINRMGFNNSGAAEVAYRLDRRARQAARRGRVPLAVTGVNIGKTKLTPEDEAVGDYVTSARTLGEFADYFVVNVSSPNTPGLRDLQAVERLRPLLKAVREALDSAVTERRVPLLVKVAPDLSDEDVDAVADLALELGLDGIIATNTTISRAGLRTSSVASEVGGLSGAPLRERALEVLRRLHTRAGDRLVLVAAGGIESGDDAWERIRAGASLVQGYTGFIYGGPGWACQIHRDLLRRMRAEGFGSLEQAIGSGIARGESTERSAGA
ncbi:quinone-dependent dihydroorotate dehydrogenase [Flindersiella endophytica]